MDIVFKMKVDEKYIPVLRGDKNSLTQAVGKIPSASGDGVIQDLARIMSSYFERAVMIEHNFKQTIIDEF